LVAAVVVEQVAQVVAAVGEVDAGCGEIAGGELVAAGKVGEEVGGGRQDLHQTLGAGRRRTWFELALRIDHGRDQRRVEVLGGGLFADDARVAERQAVRARGLVEIEGHEAHENGRHGDGDRRSQAASGHRPSLTRTDDSSRSRSSSLPSLRTTNVARPAFSSWESWRAARSSASACPLAAARARRSASADTTAIVA